MNKFLNIKFIFIITIIFYKTILNSSNYYKNYERSKIIDHCNKIIKYTENRAKQLLKNIKNKAQNLLISNDREKEIRINKSCIFDRIERESKIINIIPSQMNRGHLVDLGRPINNRNEEYGTIYLVGGGFKLPSGLVGYSDIIIACPSENGNFIASNCINLLERASGEIKRYSEEIDIRKENISLLIHTPDYLRRSKKNFRTEEVIAKIMNEDELNEEILILPIDKI
jgi:hypothetical protein